MKGCASAACEKDPLPRKGKETDGPPSVPSPSRDVAVIDVIARTCHHVDGNHHDGRAGNLRPVFFTRIYAHSQLTGNDKRTAAHEGARLREAIHTESQLWNHRYDLSAGFACNISTTPDVTEQGTVSLTHSLNIFPDVVQIGVRGGDPPRLSLLGPRQIRDP